MAILCKELIEKKSMQMKNDAEQKHNNLVMRANALREKLHELESDCTDIMDTVDYLKEEGMNIPLKREAIWGGYDNMLLGSHRCGFGIDYMMHLDYQHLMFVDGKFLIYCVCSFNGRQEWRELNYVMFEYQTDYYIQQAIRIMNEFCKAFPEFKEKFINYVSK